MKWNALISKIFEILTLQRFLMLKKVFFFGMWNFLLSFQFSSVAQSFPTLCDLMDCSTPGFPVHHQLPPRACSNSCPYSQWGHPTISSSVVRFSSCPQSFPASGSFPVTQFFASGALLALQLPKSISSMSYILYLIKELDDSCIEWSSGLMLSNLKTIILRWR